MSYRSQRKREGNTAGTVGAISELLACADLMAEGYSIFRSESPHAPFDLVAYRDGVCTRVEVKTLTSAPGIVPFFKWPVNDEWDLLAVAGLGRVFKFWRPVDRDSAQDEIRHALGYPPKNVELAPCGTLSSHNRHRSRGETCEECRRVALAHGRDYRQRRSEAGAIA